MLILAIDLGKFNSMYCFFDAATAVGIRDRPRKALRSDESLGYFQFFLAEDEFHAG